VQVGEVRQDFGIGYVPTGLVAVPPPSYHLSYYTSDLSVSWSLVEGRLPMSVNASEYFTTDLQGIVSNTCMYKNRK
jgi:hypothetical protein